MLGRMSLYVYLLHLQIVTIWLKVNPPVSYAVTKLMIFVITLLSVLRSCRSGNGRAKSGKTRRQEPQSAPATQRKRSSRPLACCFFYFIHLLL
jgi:hypothetical protein